MIRITNDKYISANDINKFTYCPYQWYYEQTYGAATLREMRRKALSERGLYNGTQTLMNNGRRFHDKAIPRRKRLPGIVMGTAVAIAIYLVLRFLL